jgi:hypothetical protein
MAEPTNRTTTRSTLLILALLAAILAVQVLRLGGPTPKQATASASSFSALRAMSALRSLLQGNVPHPIGSAAHDAVRDRLLAQFRALGYEANIESRFACAPYLVCANVDNVIARLPGQASGDALVLAAHYDSVPAGPGASDDGVGVATMLEVARAVRTEQFRNPVVFLITDGEEAGLLGAEGFVADAAVVKTAAAFINVENRGTSGSSFMFETSRNNRWLVPIIAGALERPSATSLFNSIYELMPNDTDVTVFKRAGKTAVNFAAIGNVGWYHTPDDSLEHVTLSTLQHHGDNVLALTRALGAAELRQTSDANAIFFDVLLLTLFWWPQGWSIWIAMLTFALLIVAALIGMRDGATRAHEITLGVVGFFASLIVAALLGIVGTKVALLRGGATWIAHPTLLLIAMWLLGIASAIMIAGALRRRASFDGLFIGIAICWCAIAIALDRFLSGGAYIFIVPAAAMAILAMLRAVTEIAEEVVVAITAVLAALMLYPLALTLYDALGTPVLPGVAAIVALLATTFAPTFATAAVRKVLVPLCFVAAAVCVIATIAMPRYSREWPLRLPVTCFVDGDAHTAQWQVSQFAGGVRDAGHFDGKPVQRYPWFRNPPSFYVANAPNAVIAPPEIAVVRDVRAGKRTLAIRVRSLRGAQRVALMFRTTRTVDSIRVNDVLPPASPRRNAGLAPGWYRVVIRGVEAEVEIVTRGTETIDIVALDYSFGLPPAGDAIVRARNAANAVTSDDGDMTIAMKKGRV